MPIFVRAGWLIPSHALIRWWNRVSRGSFQSICQPEDSGALTMYKFLLEATPETDEEEYDCYTIAVGPSWKQKLHVLVMTNAGIFDTALEQVEAYELFPCGSGRARQVRDLLESEGLDFDGNEVRFCAIPVCMV